MLNGRNRPLGFAENPEALARQRHLFYVVDWLPPEFGAVGQYAMLFAREIARSGRDVSLIGLGSGPRQVSVEKLEKGSLEIIRVPAKHYNKSGLMVRLIWSLRANLRLISEVVRDPRSNNGQLLFTGAPPFMLFYAVFARSLRSMRLIYRITDFYPEVLVEALGKKSLALSLFSKLTWWFRRRVDEFEALGNDQRRLLISGGIAAARITLKRDVPPTRIMGNEMPAQRPANLRHERILLYSGNYGVAHEVETVVQGLIRHREAGGSFGLWLNASGSNIDAILARLRAARVPVAHTQPGPLEQLPHLLAVADAHLISLRTNFAGLVLPSKIYGCLNSKRPILFVGPRSSDVHSLCVETQHPEYAQVEPGDAAGFALALERFEHLTTDRSRTCFNLARSSI